MVLEGVHLVPGLVPRELQGALVVHVVLEIADESVHRMHFRVRDGATGGTRAMEKYLDRLDDIRRIQTYVCGRARREGVPVVENANVDRSIDAVIGLVMDAAARVREPV
jgi:2-phosphoglycerate kinase